MSAVSIFFDAGPLWLRAMVLGVLGVVLGSFIAALVIRWPAERSVIRGRSTCDACGRVLGPGELVPVLSWAWLRGKCRSCGARIDPLHIAIELLAAAIGVVAALCASGVGAPASAVLGWLLLALAMLDARAFWLPDRLTLLLAVAGLAVGWLGIGPVLLDRLIGGAAGFGVLWAIGAGYRLARGRDGLGGGDPKLLGAIGLWVGWEALPMVVLLASMAGLGVVLFWMLSGRGARADDRLPFGTLLAVAAYPVWLAMLWAAA